MLRKVFVDSGAWISLMLEGDLYHSEAVDYFNRMEKNGDRSFTSDYVVDETLTRLLYNQSLRAAQNFYNKIQEATSKDKLMVFWIDQEIAKDAWVAFVKFAEHKLSFTDATSYALMKRYRLDEIFAFDEDFKKIGLNVRP